MRQRGMGCLGRDMLVERFLWLDARQALDGESLWRMALGDARETEEEFAEASKWTTADIVSFFPIPIIRFTIHLRSLYGSFFALQILSGQKVTVVRCEEINVSGSFFRNKLKYHAYLHSAYQSHLALPFDAHRLAG